jgi:CHASE3 domain sensor protein
MSVTAEPRTSAAGAPAIETRARKYLSAGCAASRTAIEALVHLPPTRLLVALSALFLVLSWGVSAYFAFRSHSSVIESSTVVARALGVEEQMQRLLMRLDRADAAGRAFLLTQRREYLNGYDEIAARIAPALEDIAASTAGDPLHEDDFAQLRVLVAERLELISGQIARPPAPGDASAFIVAMNERGIALMEAIHLRAWRMIHGEQARLAQRQAELAVRARFGSAWLGLFFAINTVFAGVTLLLAVRMSRLHRIAKICAWSRTIEYEGEWLSFEQYLERRFKIRSSHGISPGEAAKLTAQSPAAFAKSADSAA